MGSGKTEIGIDYLVELERESARLDEKIAIIKRMIKKNGFVTTEDLEVVLGCALKDRGAINV